MPIAHGLLILRLDLLFDFLLDTLPAFLLDFGTLLLGGLPPRRLVPPAASLGAPGATAARTPLSSAAALMHLVCTPRSMHREESEAERERETPHTAMHALSILPREREREGEREGQRERGREGESGAERGSGRQTCGFGSSRQHDRGPGARGWRCGFCASAGASCDGGRGSCSAAGPCLRVAGCRLRVAGEGLGSRVEPK